MAGRSGVPDACSRFDTESGRAKLSHSPTARMGSRMRNILYPLIAVGLFGADWTQFRGPNGSGLCPSCGQLPTKFGPQEKVLWKTELPVGKSSPVLVGDRIFLTSSEGDDLITMCLSRTNGKVQWRRSVRAARREAQNTLNHRAAPTAVTDGKSAFVFFADFGLVAYDFQGNERWRLPLGPFKQSTWGGCVARLCRWKSDPRLRYGHRRTHYRGGCG